MLGKMPRQIDPAQLDLRYEDYRMKAPEAEGRLLLSIIRRGVEQPLQGVDLASQGCCVLLNGFKRYRCARKLQLASVPYVSLGDDEVGGIIHLLRAGKDKTLDILEEARFIDALAKGRGMSVADIATELSRSKAWVSARLGLVAEMSPLVREALFSGRFPVYSYMTTLRRFMRMNGVSRRLMDSFVRALSGKKFSCREIEQLAHGFFRGPESFRREILAGNLALSLQQVKEAQREAAASSEEMNDFERALLGDLERISRAMQRVMGKCQDTRIKNRAFHAQSHLLTAGILSRLRAFTQGIRQLHDRNQQA